MPVDLRASVGKAEIWKSLGTADAREARLKASPVVHEWHQHFADLRRRRSPNEADIQTAVWDRYRDELKTDELTRTSFPSAEEVDRAEGCLANDAAEGKVALNSNGEIADIGRIVDVLVLKDAAKDERESREIREKTIARHLAIGETANISWAADDFIAREKLLIQKGSRAYKDLCQRLQRAELEALQRRRERDEGNWCGEPRDPIVKPPGALKGVKTASPGETILELFAKFKHEKRSSVTEDTWHQNEKIVRLFAEFVGETAHVSVITRRTIRDWKQLLLKWPVKASDCKDFVGLSFRKVIEANAKVGKPLISEKTVNRYLAGVASFSRWLSANDYIDQDVMSGQFLAVDKKTKKVRPYTSNELATIFASPLFRSCKGERGEHQSGDIHVRDWRFWLPLIALYTGARLGEIAQLLTTDLRMDRNIWIFHVTAEGSGDKQVKTTGSERVIPVHRELITIGLIGYHEAINRRGEKRLFPELGRDTRAHFGSASAFWNGYVTKIGVKLDRSLNFHSFRHGAADAFRRAGYLDEQFAMLLGHTKASTTQRYGILNEGELTLRLKMIEAIDYPEVTALKLRF